MTESAGATGGSQVAWLSTAMQVVLVYVHDFFLMVGVLPGYGPAHSSGLIPPDRALEMAMMQLCGADERKEAAFIDLINQLLDAESDVLPLHFVDKGDAVWNGLERFVDFLLAWRIHAENGREFSLNGT